jgi:hypothetical protein
LLIEKTKSPVPPDEVTLNNPAHPLPTLWGLLYPVRTARTYLVELQWEDSVTGMQAEK